MLIFTDGIINFLEQYGYWIVFLASFVEGESVIIAASIFASQGKLNIFYVAGLTFIGTLFADQCLYFVGRYWGRKFFTRFPALRNRAEPVFGFLQRYNTTFILLFRFIYGIRTISPIVIGISHVSVKRFMFLNFVSSVIWTGMCCSAGYWLGDVFLTNTKHFGSIAKTIVVVVLTLCVLYALHKSIALYFKKKSSR